MDAYGAHEAAAEWWEQTASLLVQRYGWKAADHRVGIGGWWASGDAAIADMAEAIQCELEDPEADPTLPLGEVLGLVTVTNAELNASETVAVPNDPQVAAGILHQAVFGDVDEEFARIARLDHDMS